MGEEKEGKVTSLDTLHGVKPEWGEAESFSCCKRDTHGFKMNIIQNIFLPKLGSSVVCHFLFN